MSQWRKKFRFAPGNILRQITTERMNNILEGLDESRPAPGGHVGMTVRQTPYGWVGSVSKTPPPSSTSTVPFTVFPRPSENSETECALGMVPGQWNPAWYTAAWASGAVAASAEISSDLFFVPNNATTTYYLMVYYESVDRLGGTDPYGTGDFPQDWYVEGGITFYLSATLPGTSERFRFLVQDGYLAYPVAIITTSGMKVTNINQKLQGYQFDPTLGLYRHWQPPPP
jgi:hypothetical protein